MKQQLDGEARKIMALTAMAENFGKEFSEAGLTMWLELLAGYPADMVHAAVRSVIERYEFKTLPPFAVLKRALDDIAGTSEKSLELQAAAEWSGLLETIPRVGRSRRPNLHPTTAHVVHVMGGWSVVCDWQESSLDFKRRDFIRHWTESHGRVDLMRLGAGAVQAALAQGRGGNSIPHSIGHATGRIIAALDAGRDVQ